jgi:glycine/D-amino acid oxidase-like deaminating enzyme
MGLTVASLGAAAAGRCAGQGAEGLDDTLPEGDVGGHGPDVGSPGASALPVLAETEVLVVGGGPAGLAAAIAAARAGADTMLVERYGFYGGVITQAIMGSITWWRYAQTVEAGGVCAEIEAKAKAMGGSINLLDATDDPGLKALLRAQAEKNGLIKDGEPTYEILRSELFKGVADALVQDAGVTPLLHCYVVGAAMDGSSVTGVVTESKSGRQVIRARRVIDCTGDADVAAFAGAPFQLAPKAERMEVTTNFSVGNVDLPAFAMFVAGQNRTMADWVDDDCGKERDLFSTHVFQAFDEAAAAGEIPPDVVIRAFPGGFTSWGEVLSLNAVHLYDIDCLDVLDLTRAEIEGRKRVRLAVDVLRKRVPGFEKAELTMIGPALGCRESRQILGGYRLTEHDVRNQARFEDSIGVFPEFLDAYRILCLPTTGRYFQVPYRITVPQGVENLLVAGRPVAGDRVSHAATRQMGCCMVTGQGAGAAAALSLADGVACRDVDVPRLQAELTRQGVRLS